MYNRSTPRTFGVEGLFTFLACCASWRLFRCTADRPLCAFLQSESAIGLYAKEHPMKVHRSLLPLLAIVHMLLAACGQAATQWAAQPTAASAGGAVQPTAASRAGGAAQPTEASAAPTAAHAPAPAATATPIPISTVGS